MTLRPFFSYYGSKWALAKHYPAPEHAAVIEPFAGSAGYATRYHDRNVVLTDTNPIIAGLWKYLVKTPSAEILKLPLVDTIDDVHACQEAKWLVGFWLGRARNGPSRTLSDWGRKGRARNWSTCFWGETIRERVARQVDQIRHWKVGEGSYENLLHRYTSFATWFVDPPYEQQGQHYVGPRPDYGSLAKWCRELPGQVIVCENAGAKWLPFKPFRTARANSSRGKGRVSHEMIWTS